LLVFTNPTAHEAPEKQGSGKKTFRQMGEEQNGGRYARRPVIAQRRMTEIDERTVEFSAKDKYSRKIVQIRCSLANLIDLWGSTHPKALQASPLLRIYKIKLQA
jgi:hypothetical protein